MGEGEVGTCKTERAMCDSSSENEETAPCEVGTKCDGERTKGVMASARRSVIARVRRRVMARVRRRVMARVRRRVMARVRRRVMARVRRRVMARVRQRVIARARRSVIGSARRSVIASARQSVIASGRRVITQNSTDEVLERDSVRADILNSDKGELLRPAAYSRSLPMLTKRLTRLLQPHNHAR
jgi:hypothetical protein